MGLDTGGQQLEQRKMALEHENLELQNSKLKKELGLWQRFWQTTGLVIPSLTLLVGLLTVGVALLSGLYTYHQSQADNFRSVIKDLADANSHVRLSAISRLFTYNRDEVFMAHQARSIFGGPSVEERNQQIIDASAASLRLEDDPGLKHEILRLLKDIASTQNLRIHAVNALKRVRIDLIRLLKTEDNSKPRGYWENLRETLFGVALGIADLSSTAPDFRCFPLRGIKVRQQGLPDKANFDWATLAFAEFWGGKARDATFRGTNLYNGVIRDFDLSGSTFAGADLTRSSFGPDIVGLTPDSFRNSDWSRVRMFAPPEFREQLRRKLGSARDHKNKNADNARDAVCTKILVEEFSDGR